MTSPEGERKAETGGGGAGRQEGWDVGLTCSHSGQWGGGGNVAMRRGRFNGKSIFWGKFPT